MTLQEMDVVVDEELLRRLYLTAAVSQSNFRARLRTQSRVQARTSLGKGALDARGVITRKAA